MQTEEKIREGVQVENVRKEETKENKWKEGRGQTEY